MADVSIRELRNHGGDVIDRVAGGERITVTRDGHRVAELRPLTGAGAPARDLIERWSRLPPIDPVRLRQDLDELTDTRL